MGAKKNKVRSQAWFSRFYKSVWLFPAILTIILVLLTALKINGSSIGRYHVLLYGNQKDSSLIAGEPRVIRSDEWLVRTPKTLAQANNNFSKVNKNIGNGENESVSLDLPYKDWSTIFRPLDWPFFVLSFEYAFALKWWLMGYLLILSAYFFTLKLLPDRRLAAACIGLILFFTPFVQWWYEYDTLASLFFVLFLGMSFINLMRSKSASSRFLQSSFIVFLLVCFALVLYPPFQIACALALAAFIIGYLLEIRTKLPSRELIIKIVSGFCALVVAGIIILLFLHTRAGPVHALENTVYPGRRLTLSGGFNVGNLLSGPLDFQLLYSSKAAYYLVGGVATNQSEASGFVMLMPFLFLPSIYMLWAGWGARKHIDWPLLCVNILFLLILARLFVAHFSSLFSLLALNRVPLQRLIIGAGLLSVIQAILVIRWLAGNQKLINKLSRFWIWGYAVLVLLAELVINLYISHASPGFIGHYRVLAFSLPIPIIVYLFLSQRYELGLLLFALFCIFMGAAVNPLYRGTAILSQTSISQQIKSISSKHNGVWVAEGLIWENFPQMNGAKSLSGVYSYPQLALWQSFKGQQDIYNRYAHVEFVIDRQDTSDTTKLSLPSADHIQVLTTACSNFLKQQDVHYLVADSPLGNNADCSQLLSTVKYPLQTFYIYRLN